MNSEMAILGLSTLMVWHLLIHIKIRLEKIQSFFVRILNLTYPQMVVICIADQICKYCEYVHIIYMTS